VLRFDTPKYYLIHHEESQVREALERIYKEEFVEEALEREKQDEKSPDLEDLFSSKYSEQLWLNLFLFLSTIVMGTTLLNYYSTYIFLGTNGTNGQAEPTSFYSQVRLLNVCMGVIKFGTTFLGSYFSDKLGRKFLYLLGYMGWSAGMLAFAVFGYENLGLEQRLVMLFLQALSGMTISTVLYTYMADTLPGKGMSFVLAIDSLVMFVYVTLFPTLMSTPKKNGFGFLGVCVYRVWIVTDCVDICERDKE